MFQYVLASNMVRLPREIPFPGDGAGEMGEGFHEKLHFLGKMNLDTKLYMNCT